MPQASQILGVNSVTNIELYKGFLPAPIIRNADWFEKFDRAVSLIAFSARRFLMGSKSGLDPCSLPFTE